MVIFLVFRSISFTSSFVHSIMPALYQTVGTTHVFIAWNTCFGFNFDFNVALDCSYKAINLILVAPIELQVVRQEKVVLLTLTLLK